MAEKGSLTEKAGVMVFARVVNTILDFAILIVVIQILNKTNFGIIGYLLMVHEIVRNLASLGFPESIFYYFERITQTARKAFAAQTSGILLIMGILAGAVILGINYFIPTLLKTWDASSIAKIQQLLPLMALVTVLEVPVWPVTNILLATDRQRQASWYEMLTTLLYFSCLVVPLVLGYSLTIAIYGLVAYAVIRFIGSIIWVMAVLPGRLSNAAEISLKNQFNFSIPLGASSMVGKMNRYADKIVVSVLLPVAAYAEYQVGAQELPIVRVIPFAVGSVLISRYVNLQLESKKDELLQLWYKGIEKVSLLVIPLTILGIVVAPDLISLIAESQGTSYNNAILPFQIYNLIVLLRVTHYGSILQAFGDTKGVLYLSLHLITVNVILSIPFTIWWGIAGTAFATLLANLFNWVLTLRRIGSHMEIRTIKVLPFGFYFRVLAAALVVAIPVWLSRFYLFTNEQVLVGLMWGITIYLGLFAGLGSLTGIITAKDWRDLKNWLSLRFFRQ